ncbi:MAG: FkbM family methyltransferase [Planctomycetota bacterium]|jgi:FkbM family methyltransferase
MRNLTAKDMRALVGNDHPDILEIGCNDGTDTLRFLEAMPRARIFAFEPDPRALKRFHTKVSSDRVELLAAAVSDTDGTATFYGSSGRHPHAGKPGASEACSLDEWDLSGSLLRPTGHLAYSPFTTFPEDRQYTVETIRLDTWLHLHHPEIKRIDFIWCDTQGAEAAVIRGGPEVLGMARYLYAEIYDYAPQFRTPLYDGQASLEELQGMLPAFDLLGIYGDNALFENRGLKCKSPS